MTTTGQTCSSQPQNVAWLLFAPTNPLGLRAPTLFESLSTTPHSQLALTESGGHCQPAVTSNLEGGNRPITSHSIHPVSHKDTSQPRNDQTRSSPSLGPHLNLRIQGNFFEQVNSPPTELQGANDKEREESISGRPDAIFLRKLRSDHSSAQYATLCGICYLVLTFSKVSEPLLRCCSGQLQPRGKYKLLARRGDSRFRDQEYGSRVTIGFQYPKTNRRLKIQTLMSARDTGTSAMDANLGILYNAKK